MGAPPDDPMIDDQAWQRTIEGLRNGDEEVLGEFCARYSSALARVAEGKIAPAMRRRFGPETVAQSACCSFLLRAREGRFEIPDSEALWRLLCAITLTKVREKARFHSRRKRGVDRETEDGGGEDSRITERIPASEPGPEHAAAIAEEFENLIGGLDEEEQRIVELRLLQCSTAEVAKALGCSERTVRRLSGQLRDRLEEAFRAA